MQKRKMKKEDEWRGRKIRAKRNREGEEKKMEWRYRE